MTRVINQKGVVFDALSVGPIEGLVEGAKSIYLDNTPLTSRDYSDAVGIPPVIETTAKCEENSLQVKVPISAVRQLIDTETSTDPLTLGDMTKPKLRYLWIEKAGKPYPGFAMASNGFEIGFTGDGSGGFYKGFDFHKDVIYRRYAAHNSIEAETTKWMETPIRGEDGWPHETDRNDLFFTATIDGIENYRTYLVGRSVDPYYTRRRDDSSYMNPARYFENKGDWETHWQHVKSINWKDMNKYYQTWHYFANPVIEWPFQREYDKHKEYANPAGGSTSWDAYNYIGSGHRGELTGWHGATLRWDVLAEITNIIPDPNDVLNQAIVTILPKDPTLHKVFTTITNAKAKILTSNVVQQTATNFKGDWDIRHGLLKQSPMELENFENPSTNLTVGPNQPLYWHTTGGGKSSSNFYGAVGTSGTSMGLTDVQVKEVDTVKLTINFPNGLFFANDKAETKKAVAEFAIYLHTRSGRPGAEYQANLVVGRLDDTLPYRISPNHWLGGGDRNSSDTRLMEKDATGSNYYIELAAKEDPSVMESKYGVIIAKTKGTFAKEFEIDLTPYRPFNDFLIEVRRVTPDQHPDYNTFQKDNDGDISDFTNPTQKTRFTGDAILSTIESQIHDKFTYPLTAYAGLSFSGAEFERIPQRTYHLRGLKVKVPSNYTTREEDLARGGQGVASYSRTIERDAHTEGQAYPSYSVAATNILRFTTDVPKQEKTSWGTAIGNINLYQTGEQTSSKFRNLESTNGLLPFIKLIQCIDRRTITSGPTRAQHMNLRVAKIINGHVIEIDDVESISVTGTTTNRTVTINILDNPDVGISTLGGSSTPITDIINGIETEYWQIIKDGAQATFDDEAVFTDADSRYDIEITFKHNIFNLPYAPWDGSLRGDTNLPLNHPNRKKVYTNNPAWIYYDILTNKEIGLGQWISESDVDKFELYQVARYCDELVPDGQGGFEARFTLNTYITKAVEAFKLLKDLCSAFRAMAMYSNGLITAVQDRPKNPIFLFTQANVINGAFTYEFTGTRARANSVLVTWNDPAQNFAQDIVAIDDTEAIQKIGRVIPKEVLAYGCTSKGQAMRLGRYHLLSEKLENEVVTFETGVNASHLQIGDIIKVQDQQAGAKIQNAGRLKFSNGWRQFELDRDVDLSTVVEGDDKWKFHIQIPTKGIFLQQDTAVINGKTLKRGDLITENKDGIKIKDLPGSVNPVTFEQKDIYQSIDIYNLVDDAGNMLSTQISNYSRVDVFDIDVDHLYTKSGPQFIQTVEPRKDKHDENIDLTGCIWTITKEAGNIYNETTCKEYKIITISHNESGTVSIAGALYKEEKFDEVEATISSYQDPIRAYNSSGYVVRELGKITGAGTAGGNNFDQSTVNIPIPNIQSITAEPHNSIDTVMVSWSPNTAQRINKVGEIVGGSTSNIHGYRVRHNLTPDAPSADINNYVYEEVHGASTNTLAILVPGGFEEGTYTIQIQAYYQVPGEAKVYGAVLSTQKVIKDLPKALGRGEVPSGGNLDTTLNFNTSTGLFKIVGPTVYEYTHPNGDVFISTSTSEAAQTTESFLSMSNGTSAYLYFDKAGSQLASPHPLKAIKEITDSQARLAGGGGPMNFVYLAPIGTSTNGLSTLTNLTATGKIQNSPGSSTIHEIKNSSGSIEEGMVVTGTGIVGTVTLIEDARDVSPGVLRIELSSAQNLSNDTVLTFTGTAKFTATAGTDIVTGTNTKFTEDFSPGDMIKLTENMAIGSTGALSEYGTVQTVLSDTRLRLEETISRDYGIPSSTIGLSYGTTPQLQQQIDVTSIGQPVTYIAKNYSTIFNNFSNSVYQSRASVVSITKANPAVVTFSSTALQSAGFTGYASDTLLPFFFFGVEGMTEINSQLFFLNPTGTNTAAIYTAASKTSGNQLDTSGSDFTTHTADTGIGHAYVPGVYFDMNEATGGHGNYSTTRFGQYQTDFKADSSSNRFKDQIFPSIGNPTGGVYNVKPASNQLESFSANTTKKDFDNVVGELQITTQNGGIATVTITSAGSDLCNGLSGEVEVYPLRYKNASGTIKDWPNYDSIGRSFEFRGQLDQPSFNLTITNGEVTGVEVINPGRQQFATDQIFEFSGWENAFRLVTDGGGNQVRDEKFGDAVTADWVRAGNFTEPVLTIATTQGHEGVLESIELVKPFSNASLNDVIQAHVVESTNMYSNGLHYTPSYEFISTPSITGSYSLKVVEISDNDGQALAYKQEQKINKIEDAVLAEVTKDSSGDYSIKYFCQKQAADTSQGHEVNNSDEASVQATTITMNHTGATKAKTVSNFTATINTPPQAVNRSIQANGTCSGTLGFRGAEVAVSGVDLSKNPIIVTTSANHGLTDNCKVAFSGFTGKAKELNGRSYFVARGDDADPTGNLDTKFRLYDSLNHGVVETVTINSGGAGMTDGTVNNVATTNTGTGTGLLLNVTVSSGAITGVAVANGGVGYSNSTGVSLVMDASPGSSLGTNSGTITLTIGSNAVKWNLDDSINGASGFTTSGSINAGAVMRQVNPVTLSIRGSIDIDQTTKTIVAADIDSAAARSFISPYVPIGFSWIEWKFGYGGSHAHSTFSDLVESKNLVVGATITQGSYSATITYVSDSGSDHAIVNADIDADTTPVSSSDVTVTYGGTDDIIMNAGIEKFTDVNATDNTWTAMGSTGQITTTGNSVISVAAETAHPGAVEIATITNVFEADDIVVTTLQPHGLGTGAEIKFVGVKVYNGISTTVGTEIIPDASAGYAPEGFNDGIPYFVHSTGNKTFKVAETKDGSDFIHGDRFFNGNEEAINNTYIIGNSNNTGDTGFVVTNTASVIDDGTLLINAIT